MNLRELISVARLKGAFYKVRHVNTWTNVTSFYETMEIKHYDM